MNHDLPLHFNEVEDLVKWIWSRNKMEQQNSFLDTRAKKIQAAKDKNPSYMKGWNSATNYTVNQVNYDLLNPEVNPGDVSYSLLRIFHVPDDPANGVAWIYAIPV